MSNNFVNYLEKIIHINGKKSSIFILLINIMIYQWDVCTLLLMHTSPAMEAD